MSKSVLDGVKVEDKAFPLFKGDLPNLVVVGHCPTCGNPIYGKVTVARGEVPVTQRSCDCPSLLARVGGVEQK